MLLHVFKTRVTGEVAERIDVAYFVESKMRE